MSKVKITFYGDSLEEVKIRAAEFIGASGPVETEETETPAATKPKASRAKKPETPAAAEPKANSKKDAEDEAPKGGKKGKLTHEDVRAEMTKYVNLYGIDAAQEDGAQVLELIFPGKGVETIKEIPNTQEALQSVVDGFQELLEVNPYKREAVEAEEEEETPPPAASKKKASLF